MRVKVDYSLVKDFVEFFDIGDFTEQSFQQLVTQFESNTAFNIMLAFYDGVFSKEQYLDILYKAICNIGYETDNPSLQLLYKNLCKLRNIDLLRNKLVLIERYEFSKMEEKLLETLPVKTEININIYFTLDGINGGSIYGNNDMLLNAMFFPSNQKDLYLIEGILLHEYHHIGFKYWLSKSPQFKLTGIDKGIDIARYLSIAILSEGAATYLFNHSHDLYPLVVESHGEDYALKYRQSMDNRQLNIGTLIRELEQDILKALNYAEKDDEIKKLINKYCFDSNGFEPRDKAIGYHMCNVIDNTLGREQLIKCFENPILFFNYYNKGEKNCELSFTSDFMNKWDTSWGFLAK